MQIKTINREIFSMTNLLTNSLGTLFLVTSIFDAIKYKLNANKVRIVGTAKGHSRQFINIAILNDLVRTAYGVSILDWYIIISSVLALIFMLDLWYAIYLMYPYRNRGLKNFHRPNILIYIWNSILPNMFRPHL